MKKMERVKKGQLNQKGIWTRWEVFQRVKKNTLGVLEAVKISGYGKGLGVGQKS